MNMLIILSLLVIPVFLLASPIFIFADKNRPDIARLYVIVLSGFQLVVLITGWGSYGQTLSSQLHLIIIGLIGLAMVIGQVIAYRQSKDNAWLYMMAVMALFTILVAYTGYQFGAAP